MNSENTEPISSKMQELQTKAIVQISTTGLETR
jgi:hypothetical protein